MGKNQHIRLSDIRSVFNLLGETRELGRTPLAWRKHMLSGLLKMINGQIGFCMEQRVGESLDIAHATKADIGWPDEKARRYWLKHIDRNELFHHPSGLALAAMVCAQKAFVRSRQELSGDRLWHNSEYFNTVVLPTGRDEFVLSYCPIIGADIHFAISLAREPFSKPFGRRDRTLVHLFHHELAKNISMELAQSQATLALNQLPPRLKQTAAALVAGDAEKQIARRLGLSRHTVHHHIRRLHLHFNVSCRGELVAKLFSSRTVYVPQLIL